MATRKTAAATETAATETDIEFTDTATDSGKTDPVTEHIDSAVDLLAMVPGALGDHAKLLLINQAGVHANIALACATKKWYESAG